MFSGRPCPEIEDGTLEEMYQLALGSEESEKQATLFIREMEERIRVYEEESELLF